MKRFTISLCALVIALGSIPFLSGCFFIRKRRGTEVIHESDQEINREQRMEPVGEPVPERTETYEEDRVIRKETYTE